MQYQMKTPQVSVLTCMTVESDHSFRIYISYISVQLFSRTTEALHKFDFVIKVLGPKSKERRKLREESKGHTSPVYTAA